MSQAMHRNSHSLNIALPGRPAMPLVTALARPDAHSPSYLVFVPFSPSQLVSLLHPPAFPTYFLFLIPLPNLFRQPHSLFIFSFPLSFLSYFFFPILSSQLIYLFTLPHSPFLSLHPLPFPAYFFPFPLRSLLSRPHPFPHLIP